MKVYIVVRGCYEDQYIAGVYSSPEKAMAAHPILHPVPAGHVPTASNASRPGGWQRQAGEDSWSNGCDWGDHEEITAHEIDP